MLPVARQVLLGFLDVALVEQGASRHGVVADRVGHRSGKGVPGQLPPPPQAEADVEARPAVEGQRVEESLHGVQDTLAETNRHKSR